MAMATVHCAEGSRITMSPALPPFRRVHRQVRDSPTRGAESPSAEKPRARRLSSHMTLPDMIDEVFEKTHWPVFEVLNLIEDNWPGHDTFTPTQCDLLVSLIGRKKQEMQS